MVLCSSLWQLLQEKCSGCHTLPIALANGPLGVKEEEGKGRDGRDGRDGREEVRVWGGGEG